MDQQDAQFLVSIYPTIFISTLNVSNDRVVHQQQSVAVYCITQLCKSCCNVKAITLLCVGNVD